MGLFMKKIFAGKEIVAYCVNQSSDFSNTVVYFDHLGSRKSNIEYLTEYESRASGPARAFGGLGMRVIIIIALRGHWYQTEEIERFLYSLKAGDKGNTKYFHVGYSMGGFGAINFAYINNAKVLVFQPQCRLGANAPMKPAYKECLDKVLQGKFEENITKNLCHEVQGYIFYDNYDAIDSWHANQICSLTKIKPIAIPYSGHGTSTTVNRTYRISCILKDFSEGRFTKEYFYSKFNVSQTDEYLIHDIKSVFNSLKEVESSKSLRSKLNIAYESGYYYYGLEVVRSAQLEGLSFSYDDIKLVIRMLLKNRNFSDLISFLLKAEKIYAKDAPEFRNLIYVGIGVAYHCLGNSTVGNDFLRKAIKIDNRDYFVVWHINKFLGVEAEEYTKKNATPSQIEILRR